MICNIACPDYLHNAVKRYMSFLDEYILLVKGFETVSSFSTTENAVVIDIKCDSLDDNDIGTFVKEYSDLVDMMSIVYMVPLTVHEKKVINKLIITRVKAFSQERKLYKQLYKLNQIRNKVYEKHVFKGNK